MLKYLKKYWIYGVLAIVFMMGEVWVDMFQPRLMATIVDDGILGMNSGGVPNIDLIWSTGWKMVLVVLAGGLCGVLCGMMSNMCSQNFGNDLRKAAFDRIMHLSFQQTDTFTTGSLITRITSDISQVERLVQQSVRGFVRCFMFLIVGTGMLMSLNVHFLTVVACAFPLVLIEIIFVLWRTNPLFTILQERIDQMNTVIQEDVKGLRVIKAYVQEPRESKRFGRANQDLVDVQLKVLLLMAFMRPIMNIVLNLATVALIWIGAVQVKAGGMAPGEVMAGVTYLSQILNGMMMLAMIFQTLSRGFASGRRVREVLDAEPEIRSPETGAQKTGMSREELPEGVDALTGAAPVADTGDGLAVRFKRVSFVYPAQPQTEILTRINLDIRKGETLAIVGATGSGKTSLVNLIPRFYDATEGIVEVNGKDVREYELGELRDQIAFVTQKSQMFSTTIAENIAIGRGGASRTEIVAAARAAQADAFITEQPEGYDTVLAEGGMSVSGGQKQRLSIARALLKDAPILILDDATSALDLRTEAALYQALDTDYADATKIIIAQRIATARRADRIAVLSEGSIAALGTHEQLLERSEIYREICASQEKKGGAA